MALGEALFVGAMDVVVPRTCEGITVMRVALIRFSFFGTSVPVTKITSPTTNVENPPFSTACPFQRFVFVVVSKSMT